MLIAGELRADDRDLIVEADDAQIIAIANQKSGVGKTAVGSGAAYTTAILTAPLNEGAVRMATV